MRKLPFVKAQSEMQTPADIYRLLVSLAAVNDADSFEEVARRFPSEYHPVHVLAFQGIAKDLQRLIDSYDFTESEAFLTSIRGKSESVATMKRKIATDPDRRKTLQQEFIQALILLPENRDAFRLLAARHHDTLNNALSALHDENLAALDLD